jgi:hypothetical protein
MKIIIVFAKEGQISGSVKPVKSHRPERTVYQLVYGRVGLNITIKISFKVNVKT